MRILALMSGGVGTLLLLGGVGALPAHRPRLRRRFAALVEASGTQLRPFQVLGLAGLLWTIAVFVVAGLTASLWFAVVVGSLAAAVPFMRLRARGEARLRSARQAWPDAIATLSAHLRSGASLPEACVYLSEEGPSELRPHLRGFASTYRTDSNFGAALDRMRVDLADPVADRVVAALRLAHEVGGRDLVALLDGLSTFLREDLRLRNEVEARWSWTLAAARVAAASPWLVVLLMSTRPQAASTYTSGAGLLVLAAGLLATVAAYRAMLWIARLPDLPRLHQ